MKPFYILFRHNKRGRITYSIYKCFDDGMIWDSPENEPLGYFETKAEATRKLAANR